MRHTTEERIAAFQKASPEVRDIYEGDLLATALSKHATLFGTAYPNFVGLIGDTILGLEPSSSLMSVLVAEYGLAESKAGEVVALLLRDVPKLPLRTPAPTDTPTTQGVIRPDDFKPIPKPYTPPAASVMLGKQPAPSVPTPPQAVVPGAVVAGAPVNGAVGATPAAPTVASAPTSVGVPVAPSAASGMPQSAISSVRVMPHTPQEAAAHLERSGTELPNKLLKNLQASLAHSEVVTPDDDTAKPVSYNTILEKRQLPK